MRGSVIDPCDGAVQHSWLLDGKPVAVVLTMCAPVGTEIEEVKPVILAQGAFVNGGIKVGHWAAQNQATGRTVN